MLLNGILSSTAMKLIVKAQKSFIYTLDIKENCDKINETGYCREGDHAGSIVIICYDLLACYTVRKSQVIMDYMVVTFLHTMLMYKV